MSDLLEVLYNSTLSLTSSPDCGADIMRQSRSFKRLHEITDVML